MKMRTPKYLLLLAIAFIGCATPAKHSKAHYEYDYPDIRHVAPELRKD